MSKTPVRAYSNSGDAERYELTWKDVEGDLMLAQMYWITSLEEGIPHTVPVIGVWHEGALYFCSPRSEHKHQNLKANTVCQALTGSSQLTAGIDVAIHGHAEEVEDMEGRALFAEQLNAKYPPSWQGFEGTEEDMWVIRVVPTHIRAFHRENPIASARFDFAADDAS